MDSISRYNFDIGKSGIKCSKNRLIKELYEVLSNIHKISDVRGILILIIEYWSSWIMSGIIESINEPDTRLNKVNRVGSLDPDSSIANTKVISEDFTSCIVQYWAYTDIDGKVLGYDDSVIRCYKDIECTASILQNYLYRMNGKITYDKNNSGSLYIIITFIKKVSYTL